MTEKKINIVQLLKRKSRKKRTKEEIQRVIEKGFPKDREERIKKFQEWCRTEAPKKYRLD